MKYAEILHRCFRCGYCKLPGNYADFNCPAYVAFRFETYSPGGADMASAGLAESQARAFPALPGNTVFLHGMQKLCRAVYAA